MSEAAVDERVETFLTPRDWLRYAVGRFLSADLAFGHGATTALDEAAFLILEGLGLPIDTLDPFLDARLLRHERARLCELIEARVTTRKPAAYLVNRAYIKGVPFYVDERVIVPRSLIGELADDRFRRGQRAHRRSRAHRIRRSISAPAAVRSPFSPRASSPMRASRRSTSRPTRSKSPSATSRSTGCDDRIALKRGDLFAPLKGERFDLILANPPYVDAATIARFPPEYAAEPTLAHAGGADGLDIVRRILSEAPEHLTAGGTLVCEVGGARGAARA